MILMTLPQTLQQQTWIYSGLKPSLYKTIQLIGSIHKFCTKCSNNVNMAPVVYLLQVSGLGLVAIHQKVEQPETAKAVRSQLVQE